MEIREQSLKSLIELWKLSGILQIALFYLPVLVWVASLEFSFNKRENVRGFSQFSPRNREKVEELYIFQDFTCLKNHPFSATVFYSI